MYYQVYFPPHISSLNTLRPVSHFLMPTLSHNYLCLICVLCGTHYSFVPCTLSLLDNILMCLDPGLLFTEEKILDIGNSGELTLECTLAGYVEELTVSEDLIDWTFNGQPLTTDSNYIISVGSRECSPYGICGLGFLRIVDVGSDDLGDYVCSFGDLSQTITLQEGDLLIFQLLGITYAIYIPEHSNTCNVHVCAKKITMV